MHFKGIIWGRVGEKFEICVRTNKNNRGSAQFIWFLFKKKSVQADGTLLIRNTSRALTFGTLLYIRGRLYSEYLAILQNTLIFGWALVLGWALI